LTALSHFIVVVIVVVAVLRQAETKELTQAKYFSILHELFLFRCPDTTGWLIGGVFLLQKSMPLLPIGSLLDSWNKWRRKMR